MHISDYLILELAVKLVSFMFFLAAYFCMIHRLSRYVWHCQQRVGSTGIIQALGGIRLNAWKKITECWGDLILRRVSHLLFGLWVHPRCVLTRTKGIPVEISFHGCCIAQELKEVMGGGVEEESRARAGTGMDMSPLPGCWQVTGYCRCHRELSGNKRYESRERGAFDFGMIFCEAWGAAGEVAKSYRFSRREKRPGCLARGKSRDWGSAWKRGEPAGAGLNREET